MNCTIRKMTEEDIPDSLAIELDLEQDTWELMGLKYLSSTMSLMF